MLPEKLELCYLFIQLGKQKLKKLLEPKTEQKQKNSSDSVVGYSQNYKSQFPKYIVIFPRKVKLSITFRICLHRDIALRQTALLLLGIAHNWYVYDANYRAKL